MRKNNTKTSRLALWVLILGTSSLEMSCAATGLQPELRTLIVAPPQIIYRIDGQRYFIIESNREEECYSGTIVYIDENLQIKSQVESWRNSLLWPRKFSIDASNDKYLGAPTEGSSGDCTSGGGRCFGDATVFSTDYGRTWLKRRQGGDASIAIIGKNFYEYELDSINTNYAGRSKGEYFDMSQPDNVAPFNWIAYTTTLGAWTLADYGMTDRPEKPSTSEKEWLAEFDVFEKAQPEKIASAPQPTKEPTDNAFHCVKKPVINND